jgi:hypothetical protein
MAKIKKPPPPYFMEHLADFDALHDWLNSNPDVPHGAWYKKFPKFILAGEGEVPKTFLTSGMAPHGTEVK